MTKILESLRTASNEMHEKLHVHPLLMPLSSEIITLDDYKFVIAAFYLAYRNTENFKMNTGLPDSPVLEWLEKDIKFHTIAIPQLVEEPMADINTVSKYIGYLYVKQGSTLGGQVISKNLNRSLSLEAGVSNIFFNGYGAQTGFNWKQFTAGLSKLESELNIDEAADSAALIFKRVANLCDGVLEVKNA